jgi:hypothetical protein
MMTAAVVAFGVTLLEFPQSRQIATGDQVASVGTVPLPTPPAVVEQYAEPQPVQSAEPPAETRIERRAEPPATPRAEPRTEPRISTRLIIEGRRAFANEPLPLGLSLNGASGGEFVLLKGLAAGTSLSAGTQLGNQGWRVPAQDFGSVFAYAPKDYVGTMDAAIDLHAGDRLIDSQIIRLEWIKKAVANQAGRQIESTQRTVTKVKIDPAELAILLRRGEELLRTGDIAAARLILRRASHAGSAQAALALGSTFDPIVLREIGVLGLAADAAQAQAWYRRASELGSEDAKRRLERLTRTR